MKRYFKQICKRCGGYGEDQENAITCIACSGTGKILLSPKKEANSFAKFSKTELKTDNLKGGVLNG